MRLQTTVQPGEDFPLAHDQPAIRIVEQDRDWQAYAAWRIDAAIRHGKPDHDIAELKRTTPAEWQDEISGSDKTYFGVFKGSDLIGLGRVSRNFTFPQSREIVLEVHPDHSKRGIGANLYRRMMDHIATVHPGEQVIALILSNNTFSRHAAETAGLTQTGILDDDYPPYLIYSRQPQAGPAQPSTGLPEYPFTIG